MRLVSHTRATKEKEMYMNCDLLTKDEDLFERLTLKRGIELLNREDVEVYSSEISRNAYGQFLFITIKYKDIAIGFWGLGEHIYRERWQDWFAIYKSDLRYLEGEEPINKEVVLKQIEELIEQGKSYKFEQSESGALFEVLAAIGDEDGAASILDDYEDSVELRLLKSESI